MVEREWVAGEGFARLCSHPVCFQSAGDQCVVGEGFTSRPSSPLDRGGAHGVGAGEGKGEGKMVKSSHTTACV